MRKIGLLSVLAALALSACGGGDNSGSSFATPASGGSGGTGGTGGTASAAIVTATASSATIPSDGSANATITAFVRDAANTLIGGVPVTFSASSGGVSGSPAITDDTGAATATLVTAGDSTLRTITVTARAGTLQGTVNVQVVASNTASTVQMGNGTGPAFVAGVMGVSNANLSAGGSTSLTVSLVQTGGTLYTGSATIGFNSPCIAAGRAEIRVNGVVASSVTTTTGAATVTYVARGCSGADTITASSTVGSQSLSATGSVTVAAATIGSISFVSATPTNIALRGTGDSSRPESSTVVFQVLDQANGPVANAIVNFALNTSVGGVALTSASATSDSQGRVQTVVNAGTVATSVKVTATVAATAITTQSSQLTVTTGIPTAGSFSLAVQCFNIEGWELDGTTTGVTARLGDRFQNPVPDGTAVTFTAEGGNIQSQCTTATTPTEGGVCTVNFRSSNPRPANGRVTLLAKAIGEESFTDVNGNGAFDPGDTFADQPEPYRDDSEDNTYQPGEDFFDFNNNGSRDLPDTIFNGVLCNDPARCGVATTRSTGIGQQNKIILSGSTATLTLPGGAALPSTVNMAFSSARTFSYWIRDVNNNVMPGGSTVTITASGAGLSVTQPATFTVPCSTIAANSEFPGITTFSFVVTSGTTSGTGVVTLTVKTPNDTETFHQISVSVP